MNIQKLTNRLRQEFFKIVIILCCCMTVLSCTFNDKKQKTENLTSDTETTQKAETTQEIEIAQEEETTQEIEIVQEEETTQVKDSLDFGEDSNADSKEQSQLDEITVVESMKDNHVHIRPHYKKPESLDKPNTILWTSKQAGGEYIEIVIRGKIFDFKIHEVTMGDNGVVDGETLFEVPMIEDNTVVVSTQQPEGMPFEVLRWKNVDGKEYEYYIQEEYMMNNNAKLCYSFSL